MIISSRQSNGKLLTTMRISSADCQAPLPSPTANADRPLIDAPVGKYFERFGANPDLSEGGIFDALFGKA